MFTDEGRVVAISISEKKGVSKKNVNEAEFIANFGIKGDAHAGKWHRQVSILAEESIQKMIEMGAKVSPGDFAENLTLSGIDVANLVVGNLLVVQDVVLEVTQIGKECHSRCAIYDAVGDCVMPREGIFAVVRTGGVISVSTSVSVIRNSIG